MPRAILIVTALGAPALGATGCDDAVPGSVLAGPRTIAIVADPPVVALDGTATLTAVVAVDGTLATPARTSWRACSPYAVIADPVRDCTGAAALALPVTADGGGALLDAATLAAAFGGLPPLPADPIDDACGRAVVPVVVVLEAELAGARLVATKQVWIGPAPPPRTNPVIAQILADGAPVGDGARVPPGATIRITADLARDALDQVCTETAAEPTELERVDVAVFVGGGAVVEPGAFGIVHAPDGSATAGWVELTTPPEPGSVPVWLVAVDPDGGIGVAHRALVVGDP